MTTPAESPCTNPQHEHMANGTPCHLPVTAADPRHGRLDQRIEEITIHVGDLLDLLQHAYTAGLARTQTGEDAEWINAKLDEFGLSWARL